jgi:two-component system nitrogen regulation sensor histidine kinase GlnL
LISEPRENATNKFANHLVPQVVAVIGMAEMLAHEIQNLPVTQWRSCCRHVEVEDCCLTDLIVEESRRIVKLLNKSLGNRPPQ